MMVVKIFDSPKWVTRIYKELRRMGYSVRRVGEDKIEFPYLTTTITNAMDKAERSLGIIIDWKLWKWS